MFSDFFSSNEKFVRFALSNYKIFFKDDKKRNLFLKLNFVDGVDELFKILKQENNSYFNNLPLCEDKTFSFIVYKPFVVLSSNEIILGGDSHVAPIIICNAYIDKIGKLHKPFLMCFDSLGQEYLKYFIDQKGKEIFKEIDIMDYTVLRQFSNTGCVEDAFDILITLSDNEDLLTRLHNISFYLDTRRNSTKFLSFMIPFTERFDTTRDAINSFRANGELGSIDFKEKPKINIPELKLRRIFRNGKFINLEKKQLLNFVFRTGKIRDTLDLDKITDVSPIDFEARSSNYNKFYQDSIFQFFQSNNDLTKLSKIIKTEDDLENFSYLIDDFCMSRNPEEFSLLAETFFEESEDSQKPLIRSFIDSIKSQINEEYGEMKLPAIMSEIEKMSDEEESNEEEFYEEESNEEEFYEEESSEEKIHEEESSEEEIHEEEELREEKILRKHTRFLLYSRLQNEESFGRKLE